ncbi:hypothetical protein G7046_g3882 [Stylonectria norvegica]|nr:hypothetical protein G7046_g3882 [Stylonectria norvegica]
MRIETCDYCGRPAYPSKGITFVRNDAKAFRFCRSKCHRNFKLKRNPRSLKWTKAYRKKAGKEMTVDTTLLFGARRNEPIRYDRDLVSKTLKAMERINEIRSRRERAFFKQRMAGKKARELANARKLVVENQHLLPRLRGSEKRAMGDAPAEEVEAAALKASKKTKAFGGEKRRLRARVDGGVEEIIERVGGDVENGDEDDFDEEHDFGMDMD